MVNRKKDIYGLIAFGLNMGMLSGMAENILILLGFESGNAVFSYLLTVNKLLHIFFMLSVFLFLISSVHLAEFAIISFGWICMGLVSLCITSEISVIFLKGSFYSIRNVIIVIFCMIEIQNFEKFKQSLYPYILIGIMYSISQIGVFKLTGIYSMDYSYSVLIVTLLCMLLAFQQKEIKYFLLTAGFVSTIILCGSRGALVCCFITVIIYIIVSFDRRQRMLILLFLGVLCIVALLILKVIFQWVYQYFPTSRTIQLFAEGNFFYFSGRNEYYLFVINSFFDSPLKINGLYSDRYYIGNYFGRMEASNIFGSYSHNYFLEILFQFGVWGIPFLIISVLTIGYSIKKIRKIHDSSLTTIFIIFASYCIGRLLFSGSYLTDLSYGGFVGIILSLHFRERRFFRWRK